MFSGNQQFPNMNYPFPNNPPYLDQMPNNPYDFQRMQTEINELKRNNADMVKRISRLENYLGIRGENENIW